MQATPDAAAPNVRTMMQYDANKKSVGVAYALWFFFGALGGHRFYLGRSGSAIAMLVIFFLSLVLTVVFIGWIGLFVVGIWALIDAFLIPGIVRDYNNRLIASLA